MFDSIEILNHLNGIAKGYNLSADIFIITYLLSIIPFYLGYFLILRGSTRDVQFKDVIRFKIKKLKWNRESTTGLLVHLFGRAMPYAYIAFWGENLPTFANALVFILLFVPCIYFAKKIYSGIKIRNRKNNFQIIVKDVISEISEIEEIWKIYSQAFSNLSVISPCRQSFDREHFIEVLKDPTAKKNLIYCDDNNEIAGIAIISNNFKNSPWISEEYFKNKFSEDFSKGLVYYFMGLAIHPLHNKKGYSIALIEKIIDDLPHGSIMGFDHSNNINPFLHYFTHIVKQARSLKREHIDKQHYHVVYRK